MKLFNLITFVLLIMGLALTSCENFDELNENPNEPTVVSSDVLMTSAIRNSVNTMVNESFLLGNNAAQLTAKTLRTEVDAYNWNAFPTVWEGMYGSLTDVFKIEEIAVSSENAPLEGVAIVLRSWIFSVLTNAYGDVPYFEAIRGEAQILTPAYTPQSEIYSDLLSELERAESLLMRAEGGEITGDILFNGNANEWMNLANSLRLRLAMYANNQLGDEAQAIFEDVVASGRYISSNAENAALEYLNAFPNQFPLVPLKSGDFEAVAISITTVEKFSEYDDPRLFRYARPSSEGNFGGAENGAGTEECSKGGSLLGYQYYNVEQEGVPTAAQLGLDMAEGIIMTYAEVEFLLAEAKAKGWDVPGDVESHYKAGVEASVNYHQSDFGDTQWGSFEDFYDNSGIAYNKVTDIWEQKWAALFFHGLEPYFEVRRWYFESDMSWDGIPFLNPPCSNVNNDDLPMRFLYPGEEQSLNATNYNDAVSRLGGSNSQNAAIWLVQ